MAIYHLSSSVISRSQGRSAVACAAYRSATRLQDEAYGRVQDYSKKQDVVFSEILLPPNAPEWMKDRERLWNTVEQNEKRKDAQLAREIQISLPRELTTEQNIELARAFIRAEFVAKGMIADWAFHLDHTAQGEEQPHVHVLLTMREVTAEGFGQKVRDWNRKEHLLSWREAWAETANRHLALNGHEVRIDHRSYAEQGIELEPQHKIGAAVVSERMARYDDHQRIACANGEKIYEDPAIALTALTRQQSTFTHQDLARFIHRHTVDGEQFDRVYYRVKGCEHIVSLGVDAQGRERFTTHDMIQVEQRLLIHSMQLNASTGHNVAPKAQQQGMGDRTLTVEQRGAYEHVLAAGDLKCLVGYAGTGKSYLLGAARTAWEAQGYQVKGATLAGIAAENLEASSGIESRTLASRMYYWERGEQLLTSNDILVVDEAGMIGSRQMERLLDEAQKHNTKVVLIGDPEQLQAIEAGAAFRAISERVGYVELTEIRRQQQDWQRIATQELARGETRAALERYQQHTHIHEFETQAEAKKSLVDAWNDARITSNPTQIMLAYTRKDAQELNTMARTLRQQLGELGLDQRVATARGERLFAEQDRLYFLQNNRTLGVKNGTLGALEKIEGAHLTIRLDNDPSAHTQVPLTITVDLNQYNHLDHGYAATIHKAQGVTVDRSYVLASTHMDRHATYVSLSRHRDSVDLFWSRDEFSDTWSLGTLLGRERSKDVILDYKAQAVFTTERGIEPHGREGESIRASYSRQERFERHGREAQASPDLADLMSFARDFEQQNPELAQQLTDELRPKMEKKALELQQKIEALTHQVKTNSFDFASRQALKELVNQARRDPALMGYLQQHMPEFNQKMTQLSREYSASRGLGRGY